MSFGSCLRTRLFRTVSAFVFCCLLAPFSLAADGVDLGTSPEQSLQNGLKLETNRRWFESVRHYEQATRKWPEDRTLEQRLMVCRVHADVERRYLDHSFLRTVDETSTDRALELYSEVLTQLESDYVHKVDWAMLQRHGTAFLEVALTEPQFLKKHLANVQPEIIEDFRLHVHEYIANRPQRTRFDVRDTAAYVAGLARQKLGLSGGATVLEYVCGAVGLLDPYTRFLTPQQLDETLSNIKGNFVGLGVELKCETEHLRIVSVIRGGPADQAGIKAGDKILAVNQATVGEYAAEAVADMLRGPEGSYVDLKLARTGGNVDAMQLQRRRVEVPCIENVHMADPAAGVGYLRLTAFKKPRSPTSTVLSGTCNAKACSR